MRCRAGTDTVFFVAPLKCSYIIRTKFPGPSHVIPCQTILKRKTERNSKKETPNKFDVELCVSAGVCLVELISSIQNKNAIHFDVDSHERSEKVTCYLFKKKKTQHPLFRASFKMIEIIISSLLIDYTTYDKDWNLSMKPDC
jgi:hypothetical protein